MKEVWKEINGADGYFVSPEGRVRHGENITITFESQTSCAKFLERNQSAVAWAVTRGSICAGGRIEYA